MGSEDLWIDSIILQALDQLDHSLGHSTTTNANSKCFENIEDILNEFKFIQFCTPTVLGDIVLCPGTAQ